MTYLAPHKKPYGMTKIIVIICLIILVIAASIQLLFPHFFPGLFSGITQPFWRMEFAIESGSLSSPSSLLSRNEELKRKLAEYDVRMQSILIVENENTELKSLLGRASSTLGILTAILKRPPVVPYDEFIIDGGTDLGFKVGDKILAPGNVLIGNIADVLPNTSKVTLLSSPGQKYEVLLGIQHTPITALGRGGGQYEAEVSKESKPKEGDIIIDPSQEDRAFGVVTGVISDPAEAFETVLFAPPLNVYQLRWVVVKK